MDKNEDPGTAKPPCLLMPALCSLPSPTCELFEVFLKFMGEFILKTKSNFAPLKVNKKMILSEYKDT